MNDKRYTYILYIIVVVIIATIGIQAYWNYKNYLSNKQQLIIDLQTSLDKVVDDYYTDLAQKTTLGLTFEGENQKNVFSEGGILEKISKSIDEYEKTFNGIDSLNLNSIEGITIIKGLKADSLLPKAKNKKFPFWNEDSTKQRQQVHLLKADSIANKFKLLTSKVIISINKDTLNVAAIDSLLQLNLKDKQIDLNYQINYSKPIERFPRFFSSATNKTTKAVDSSANNNTLNVTSKSTFLPKGSTLGISFDNANWAAFKKGISAILISTLLVLAVISCLFFLLKIIKEQKQLAEVKNDLISNITHEFKTPIATIGVALESISNFNVIEDKEKTKQYVDMSSNQLSKLNLMVEKLLETATLDSESLKFNKEPLDVSHLLDTMVNRYKTQHQNKNFNLHLDSENTVVHADVFHFENALNNILDNAVKYGGDDISVHLKSSNNDVEISISDNGNALKKENKHKIFEKFYRIPKGNTHDVKGYGIGLYYTKTIINKHNGTIALDLSDNLTSFKISIPNG